MKNPQEYYTPYTIVPGEQGRIGLMSCRICGAAVMLDPTGSGDAGLLHLEHHRRNNELPDETEEDS